jgi:succinyl-diaminopimelate desuccinylase
MDLGLDIVDLTSALIGMPSESRYEQALADSVEVALRQQPHLTVERIGNTVIARTQFGHAERVVIAGHLDTVPSSGNDRGIFVAAGATAPVADAGGSVTVTDDRLYGLGACDMKGGVAVALRLAHDLATPTRDVTYVFYDCEEIEASANGLKRIVETRPELLAADFAILMEPSGARVEAGCQGTMRIEVSTSGRRAHTARAWTGSNAIHATAEILRRLVEYVPRRPVIDGLEFREGLQAVAIRGGVAGNVVPDVACVTINHRFAPDRSAADAETHLRELFAGFEIVVVDVADGALPGLSHPAAAAFIAAVGGDPQPKFGWTDVARFTALGLPAVNYGPGDPALAHTPHEYVPVSQLSDVLERMTTWLSC